MTVFRLFFFPSFLLLIGLVLGACRVNRDEEPDIVFTGEPEFSVDLFEQRDSADGLPTFGLWVESIKPYACAGYQLQSEVALSGDTLRLQLGVRRPDTCLGAPEKAKGFVRIGNVPVGAYHFLLTVAGTLLNEGTLDVTTQGYSLSLPTQQGIDFQNLVLRKIPDGLVWGYVLTPEEADQPIANQFITDLKALTDEPGLAPGFYGYFTVSGTQAIYLHRSLQPEAPATTYVRRLTGSLTDLRGLLQTFRVAQAPLTIKCLTTSGEL